MDLSYQMVVRRGGSGRVSGWRCSGEDLLPGCQTRTPNSIQHVLQLKEGTAFSGLPVAHGQVKRRQTSLLADERPRHGSVEVKGGNNRRWPLSAKPLRTLMNHSGGCGTLGGRWKPQYAALTSGVHMLVFGGFFIDLLLTGVPIQFNSDADSRKSSNHDGDRDGAGPESSGA